MSFLWEDIANFSALHVLLRRIELIVNGLHMLIHVLNSNKGSEIVCINLSGQKTN